ncbi:hypothetical protein DDZ18_09965 [Marinicauda salina]|uniref:Apple domain-containing protein n=2 Tax=Marinicauda salina TaxID=2135793 RepID=A0A2U2BSN0_9PROT|nr:hypothetical protein DDZ18_09965 [Marinicauda salina]
MTWMLPLLLLAGAGGLPDGAVLEGHERRGAVIERLHGAPAESWAACSATCALEARCRAWTWRPARPDRGGRCELLSSARTPAPHPVAVTGLSEDVAARIEAAGERPPNRIEQRALIVLDGHPASGDLAIATELGGELAGAAPQ